MLKVQSLCAWLSCNSISMSTGIQGVTKNNKPDWALKTRYFVVCSYEMKDKTISFTIKMKKKVPENQSKLVQTGHTVATLS